MRLEEPLTDTFGRRITHVRIALTEACNFRCVYCMPAHSFLPIPSKDVLTSREITRFVRAAGRLGISHVRLTGGEPLLRPDIVEIVRSIKATGVVEDLSMTTNGSLLAPRVAALKGAGLHRMNISLDSLDPRRFARITLNPAWSRVVEGITLALKAGFPVKVNLVALKGLTQKEILDFVGWARDFPLEVRFLEFMPLCGDGWKSEWVYPIGEIRAIVHEHFELKERPRGDAAAQTFEIAGGKGTVGFIAPLTEPFCNRCSRIRLSADGRIRPCLFSNEEISVREFLKCDEADEKLIEAIRTAVCIKPKGGPFSESVFSVGEPLPFRPDSTPLMRRIGG